MKSGRVYTPQMIVNGTEGFVGSNRVQADKSIQRMLKQSASVGLLLQPERRQDQLRIRYEISDLPERVVLNVALVESGLTSKVLRGENGGRQLLHENVVRVFKRVKPGRDGQGTVRLNIPKGVVIEKAAVIGYVQDAGSMRVLGAQIFEFENE